MLCEMCGEKPATVKARVENSILNVCDSCSSLGKTIGSVNAPKPLRFIQPKYFPNVADDIAEENVIANFGAKIRNSRSALQLTQEELALKVGINLNVLKDAEAGKRLDIIIARKLERLLKIKLVENIA